MLICLCLSAAFASVTVVLWRGWVGIALFALLLPFQLEGAAFGNVQQTLERPLELSLGADARISDELGNEVHRPESTVQSLAPAIAGIGPSKTCGTPNSTSASMRARVASTYATVYRPATTTIRS
jgi:hypothetical protein